MTLMILSVLQEDSHFAFQDHWRRVGGVGELETSPFEVMVDSGLTFSAFFLKHSEGNYEGKRISDHIPHSSLGQLLSRGSLPEDRF